MVEPEPQRSALGSQAGGRDSEIQCHYSYSTKEADELLRKEASQ